MKMGKWQIKIGLALVAILAIYLAYKKKLGPFGDPAIMDLFSFGKDKVTGPPAIPELVVGGDVKSPNAFQGPSQGIGTGNLTTPLTKPDEDVRQTFMREMYKQTYLPFSEYPFLYDNPSYLNPNNPTGVPVRGGDLPNCAPQDDAWYDMWYKLYGFYPPASTATNCNPSTYPPIPTQPVCPTGYKPDNCNCHCIPNDSVEATVVCPPENRCPYPDITPSPIPIPDGDPGSWEGGVPVACWPCPPGQTCTAQCYPKTGPCPPYYEGDCNAICDPMKNTEYYQKCKDCCQWGCPSGKRWSACKHTCVTSSLTESQLCPPPPPQSNACRGPPVCKSSCSKAECNILKRWKELACKFTREADAACPGSGLGGKIQCKVKTAIATAWMKNYARSYAKCGASNQAFMTSANSAGPGYGYAFTGVQRPIGQIIEAARGIAIA